MNKTELVAAIADKAELSKKDSEKALKAFVDVVTEELKKEHVQNVTLKYVLDVNHVLLQQDLPEQEHSPMENYLYPRT